MMRDQDEYDFMRDPDHYSLKLNALLRKHGMRCILDAGDAELTHPKFGKCRIYAYHDREDYEKVVAFLESHGVDP